MNIQKILTYFGKKHVMMASPFLLFELGVVNAYVVRNPSLLTLLKKKEKLLHQVYELSEHEQQQSQIRQ
jgi:hypothetical protein